MTKTKIVLSGGPCCGKTSVITELEKRGYPVLPEVARLLIEREQQREVFEEKRVLPWTQPLLFQHRVIQLQLEQESLSGSDLAFLDRSLVDIVAYLTWYGLEVPSYLTKSIQRANYTSAFILDPLPFYESDAQRRESPEDSLELHNLCRAFYTFFHIPVVHVPSFSITQRADFILNRINEVTL